MSMCGILIFYENHITMDIILLKTKGKIRKALSLINGSISVFVIVFAFVMGIKWVSTLYVNQLITNSGVFYWWQAGIWEPIGMGISVFFAVALVIKYLSNLKDSIGSSEDTSKEQLTM